MKSVLLACFHLSFQQLSADNSQMRLAERFLLIITAFIALTAHHRAIYAQVVVPTIPIAAPKSANTNNASGQQIIVNGRTIAGAWLIRSSNKQGQQIYVSDAVLKQVFGVDFLSSSRPGRQTIQWFSAPINLQTIIGNGYRYLNTTEVLQRWGWQVQINGKKLIINTPQAVIQNLKILEQPTQGSPSSAVISLNRPTAWQLRQELPRKVEKNPHQPSLPVSPPHRDWTITIDGIVDSSILERYKPTPIPPLPPTPNLPNLFKQQINQPSAPTPSITPTVEPLIQGVEVVNNQTLIRLSLPVGFVPQISTRASGNISTLHIDAAKDAFTNRQIAWAEGINWRQQIVNLGTKRFPVHLLEINPRRTQMRPILTDRNSQQGIAPLLKTAQTYTALGAINGGYFNRNNRLPLGAVRNNGKWLSGPILNRGAIAWNDAGQFYFGRLALKEQLIAGNNPPIPILYLNSGFVQSGLSRYTPEWGSSYTTMTNNEVIVAIANNRIITKTNAAIAGEEQIPIPRNGYLLVFRGTGVTAASNITPGTAVRIDTSTQPSQFASYPYIIGAGPLLIQNQQIVLDGAAEKFSPAFIKQKAVRSAICSHGSGNIFIAAVHEGADGRGPTLEEHAQLMQKLGCINALNLDGGSSTSLYLGGQLVNRSANTAARVHNGIGIFWRRP